MAESIRKTMWEAMEDSPFLMVGLTGSHEHSEPMTAQLDKNADGCFWFYTRKDNRLAPGGPAMAQFASKGHDVFACLSGNLVVESDPEVIDRYWSAQAAAWYENGREDPNLLMLRFDLDDAEIWTSELEVKGIFKLITGQKVKQRDMGEHAEVSF